MVHPFYVVFQQICVFIKTIRIKLTQYSANFFFREIMAKKLTNDHFESCYFLRQLLIVQFWILWTYQLRSFQIVIIHNTLVLFMQLYKTLQYVVKHKFEKDVNAIKNLKLLDIFQNGHKSIQDPTTRENEVKIVNLYKI